MKKKEEKQKQFSVQFIEFLEKIFTLFPFSLLFVFTASIKLFRRVFFLKTYIFQF